MSSGVELKMNRNTAELYRMPLEGGGGSVFLLPLSHSDPVCRFAEELAFLYPELRHDLSDPELNQTIT